MIASLINLLVEEWFTGTTNEITDVKFQARIESTVITRYTPRIERTYLQAWIDVIVINDNLTLFLLETTESTTSKS